MLIKVYAIGFPYGKKVKYITPKTRLSVDYTGTIEYKTTSDISDATHYETKKLAELAVKNFGKMLDRQDERIDKDILKIKTEKNAYRPADRIKELNRDKTHLHSFAKHWGFPEVFEYETEELESNLFRVRKHKIQFIRNWDGTRYSCGGVDTITESTNKHYCKVCGIRMKNIPFLFFDGLNNLRICVKCATALGDRARTSWESVDATRREVIDKEHFLNQLDD